MEPNDSAARRGRVRPLRKVDYRTEYSSTQSGVVRPWRKMADEPELLDGTAGAHAPATARGSYRERNSLTTTRDGNRKCNSPATRKRNSLTEKPLTFRSTSCTFCRCRKGMDRCGQPSYTTHRNCETPACQTP